ncbi:hypothetical protein [Promicromonospora soli]
MNKLIAEILWLGYEDVTGLWEVPWGTDSNVHDPDPLSPAERVDTFVELMRSGLIEVSAGPDALDFDEAQRISPDEARKILQEDPQVWEGPETGEFTVRFQTTDAGIAAYRSATGWVDPEE